MNTILVDRQGGVATITLNRPDRLNAYTGEMGAELYGALHELDHDDAVRAIIVTGAGRAFCAGADLAGGGATFAGDRAFADAAAPEAKVRPWNLATPIIAAINGPAVGIGATLPLQWDVRLCSERAKIGYVFTRRGITPEVLSSWLLPRLIGFSRAMELLISGRILSAAEALELGIVSRVLPHDDLLPAARALGAEIAAHTSPVAVAAVKRLLWRQLGEPDPRAALVRENQVFNWIGKQPDAAEGVTAFLEKRAPVWSGNPHDLPPALADLPEE